MKSQEKITEKDLREKQSSKAFEKEMAEAFKQFMSAHFPITQNDEYITLNETCSFRS